MMPNVTEWEINSIVSLSELEASQNKFPEYILYKTYIASASATSLQPFSFHILTIWWDLSKTHVFTCGLPRHRVDGYIHQHIFESTLYGRRDFCTLCSILLYEIIHFKIRSHHSDLNQSTHHEQQACEQNQPHHQCYIIVTYKSLEWMKRIRKYPASTSTVYLWPVVMLLHVYCIYAKRPPNIIDRDGKMAFSLSLFHKLSKLHFHISTCTEESSHLLSEKQHAMFAL